MRARRGLGSDGAGREGREGGSGRLSQLGGRIIAGRPAERAIASEQAKVKVLDFLSILQTGLAAAATAATAAPCRRSLPCPPDATSGRIPALSLLPSLCTTPMAFGKSGALTAMAKAAAIPELNFDGRTE